MNKPIYIFILGAVVALIAFALSNAGRARAWNSVALAVEGGVGVKNG